MILMPQSFDVTANENARYKRNELELVIQIPGELCGITYISQPFATVRIIAPNRIMVQSTSRLLKIRTRMKTSITWKR